MSESKKVKFARTTSVFCAQDLQAQVGCGLFSLVRIATIRALELANGRPPLVHTTPSEKTTTIALREISDGKVTIKQNPKK